MVLPILGIAIRSLMKGALTDVSGGLLAGKSGEGFINVRVLNDKRVIRALRRMRTRLAFPEQPHEEVGDHITKAIKKRMKDEVGPDGTPWDPLKDSTLEMRARRTASRSRKALFEKGQLRRSIRHSVSGLQRGGISRFIFGAGEETVTIIGPNVEKNLLLRQSASTSSRMTKAAVQQGQGQGTALHVGFHGSAVPSRPYVGLSDDDEAFIDRTFTSWASRVIIEEAAKV